MIKLSVLEGNIQKYDGGAMYGHIPRVLWQKWSAPDERNRITLTSRSLLARTDDGKNILFEAGVGNFFEPELKERYGITESGNILLDSLKSVGMTDADIDAVVLSHLHFDHVGGLLSSFEEGANRLLFPRARFYISASQWRRAKEPHSREKASFLPELNRLIQSSGRLVLVDEENVPELGDWLKFRFSDGNTSGLLISEIRSDQGTVVFASDLIPGRHWVHLPVAMGYDRSAELIFDEKKILLEELVGSQDKIFFVHDPDVMCGIVKQGDAGRYYAEPASI